MKDATGDPLAPYAPRIAARWLRDSPSARHQLVAGTLVSADISGFTSLSERLAVLGRGGAEAVVGVVNDCFEEMIAKAEAYGGDVLKFGGDALLILFDGDDHARRAAVACAELRAVLVEPRHHPDAGDIPLSMSIGLHSGELHLFLGRGLHAELIVAGRDASRAVQCESDASAGQILASPETAALLPEEWTTPFGDDPGAGHLLDPPLDVAELRVPPEVVEVDHSALVPPNLARHVQGGGIQGQIRPVTTAFIGFSGLDEAIDRTGPRRVARTLQALVEVVSQATESFDVHWLDTDIAVDGGKIHLTAGAPTATDDDDAAMLHAVRAILDTCPDPPLSAGVNHGVVFVGDVGAPTRRTLAAMGDSVNLAARLSGKAGPGELVAHLDVVEGAGARFEAEPMEPFLVKGKAEPILAAKVGAELENTEVEAGHDLPLVARSQEMATLEDAVAAAVAGEPRVVILHGPNGIGKSRLATELRARAAGPVRVLDTSCDPHQASTPFAPFRDLLRQVAHIPADADAEEAGRLLLEHVAQSTPDLAPWTPLLAIPIGATVPPTPEADRVAAAFRRLRLQQAVTDYVRDALTTPTVMVFEDTEWLDEASKDLLADLLIGMFERPWCLVIANKVRQDADTDTTVIPLEVDRLAAEDMRRLASLALGEQGLLPHEVDEMVDVAAGHPLFLLEMVAHVREGGRVDDLPRTVESAITSRMDHLSPEHLARLRELAVLGTRVPRALAESVLGSEAGQVEVWDAMQAFVIADDERITFREGLYQKVAYEGLAFARRQELHAATADALAEHPSGTIEWLTDRARHEDRAGRHEAAWHACVAAGDAMRDIWAQADAAHMYRRALDNADALGTVPSHERADVAERLGDAAEVAALNDQATNAYELALSLHQRRVDQARLLQKAARVDLNLGRYDRGVGRLDQALELLDDQERDNTWLARAKVCQEYASIRYRQARFDETLQWADRALEAVEGRDELLAARTRFIRSSAQMQQNDPTARSGLALALATFLETGDLIQQGHCHTNLGNIAHYAGDWERALEHYQSARQVYGDAGYAKGAAMQYLNFGEILAAQRRWSEAVEALREARRRYRAMNAPLGVASADGHLGWIHAATGEVQAGIELLQQAVAQFEELEAADFAAVTRAQLAEVLADAGRIDEAEGVLDLASDGSPAPMVRSSLARVEGKLALAEGDRMGARTEFERARRVALDERLAFDAAIAGELLLPLLDPGDERDALAAGVAATFDRLGVVMTRP